MSYYQRSPALNETVDCFLHLTFGMSVQCRGCFIEYKNIRVFQNGPCNSQALPLSTGKSGASLPYYRTETPGKLLYELKRVRDLGSQSYFFYGDAFFTIRNVVPYRIVEKDCLLCDNTKVPSQSLEIDGFKITSINQN